MTTYVSSQGQLVNQLLELARLVFGSLGALFHPAHFFTLGLHARLEFASRALGGELHLPTEFKQLDHFGIEVRLELAFVGLELLGLLPNVGCVAVGSRKLVAQLAGLMSHSLQLAFKVLNARNVSSRVGT
jgi:hypothetical protein